MREIDVSFQDISEGAVTFVFHVSRMRGFSSQQLVLSVNTIKKHLANLYGELNVQSRAQAIAKTHRLQLL